MVPASLTSRMPPAERLEREARLVPARSGIARCVRGHADARDMSDRGEPKYLARAPRSSTPQTGEEQHRDAKRESSRLPDVGLEQQTTIAGTSMSSRLRLKAALHP
jgi:hypothetical protein